MTTWAEKFSNFFKDVARGFDAQVVGWEMEGKRKGIGYDFSGW